MVDLLTVCLFFTPLTEIHTCGFLERGHILPTNDSCQKRNPISPVDLLMQLTQLVMDDS